VDYEAVNRALAAEVREWRRERRLSQESLAELSDLHRNALANVERLETNPKLETLVLIANAMQMSLSQLFAAVEKRCATGGGVS
jgi:XRE family transcriptional regulator, regulator of sulfur utilization